MNAVHGFRIILSTAFLVALGFCGVSKSDEAGLASAEKLESRAKAGDLEAQLELGERYYLGEEIS